MSRPIDDHCLDQVFRDGRSHGAWTDEPVSEVEMRAIYELTKLGPTSANCSPARFVWVCSQEGKARLKPHLSATNAEKVLKAPATVIIGYDLDFARELPRLFPAAPTAKDWFAAPEVAQITAFRNGTLQGGYFIMAARAWASTAGRCPGSTTPAWTATSSRARRSSRISSARSARAIRPSSRPAPRA